MANTTVGASVQVEFASVGQMRKAIKEATSDLIAMQEQFGKTSPQAIAAAKRIAELKDRIQDAKEQADLFDPGKRFSAFANAANQIAAGFSAVQGAMALVGTESEDLQKTLVKVQGAIALSQGLSQLKDLGKAYDEVKIVAVDAFKSIRAAIGSTGIGLLVVALAAIVAYWDDIKEAVSGVSAEQKKLNEDSAKNLKTQQDKLDAINGQENILKLQGKSEKEILQIKIKQTDEIIKASEIQLQNSIDTTKAQVAAAQRNKDILQGILVFISAPIAALLKGIDLIGDAVGKNFDLYNKFYGGISSFVFDPKEVKEEGDAAIKEQEKALIKLRDDRAGLQLQITKIDQDEAKKRSDIAKKEAEDAAKLAKERAEARAKEQRDINELIQKELDDQFAKDEARRKQIEDEIKASEARQFQLQVDAAKRRFELQQELNAKTLQAEIELQNAKFDAASAGLNAIATLAGENEKLANIVFAVDKALAIARIVVDTQREIAGYAATNAILGPAGLALTATQSLAAKIRAATSIATIVATSISKFKKGGGANTGGASPSIASGGTAPVSAQASPAVTAQALNAQAINNLGNQGMRAYVLNSDIQNNEQRNAYLQRNARIG